VGPLEWTTRSAGSVTVGSIAHLPASASRRLAGGLICVILGNCFLTIKRDFTVETWRRNLYVVWVAELLAIAGFSVAFPFLPYYVQELGVTKPGEVEMWSGIIIAAQAVTMAVFSLSGAHWPTATAQADDRARNLWGAVF